MCCQIRQTFAYALRRALVTASILAICPCVQPTATAAGSPNAPAPRNRTYSATPSVAAPADFPAVVERYGPAVVNISATASDQQTASAELAPIDQDDPFFAFFKRLMPGREESQANAPRAMSGIGSGFLISSDGLILTTAHVVDHADNLVVKLTDRREFNASVLAVDAQSDLALIKIEATKLTALKLGDSSRVRVGEQVLAIGSPYGFENTVTAGVVSATPHALPDGTDIPFIQTDVAINPDNSGGPVFNRAGEVIGINVQIYADAERYRSLTFAIPINLAAKLRTRLQVQGRLTHGSLGIDVQDVDPGLAGAFGLSRPSGALVDSVEQGTPAAAGGLKPGDVIVHVDNKAIARASELSDYVSGLQPGTKATVTVIRNRRPVTTTIAISALDESASAHQADGASPNRLGLVAHPLTDDERRANALAAGLVVDGVFGAAANAGIHPGDIVLSVNGTPIMSREQLAALTAKAGKEIALLVLRDNIRSFISVELR
ncbi:MAG: serine protease Do [Paraburkholderia sp.]|nr:serine protease Do [Paraburkholderia sp.]